MNSFRKGGKTYYRSRCKKCNTKRWNEWLKQNPEAVKANQDRQARLRKEQRGVFEEQDKYIYWDSRKSDRKRGLKNDLSREFIRELISRGCVYCGEQGAV